MQYLGNIITPSGLNTNPNLVSVVQEFYTPRNVQEIRRFLGLCSYYRRFIPRVSKVAQPLYNLTRKDVLFQWNEQCAEAFRQLKNRLTYAPVLAYPSFEKDFVLQTDTSIEGIGGILSQTHEDNLLHSVPYASRSLSLAERRYGITELETLTVVWTVSHVHPYLYGHSLVVYTDHAAVRALLEAAKPSAKHARQWANIYGSGIKYMKLAYRHGRVNANADALSRGPQGTAPVQGVGEDEYQIFAIQRVPENTTIVELLLRSITAIQPDVSPMRNAEILSFLI